MLEFLKVTYLVLLLSYYTLIPDDVIFNIAVYADDTTLKCELKSDVWQQLEFASELVSDLRDTIDLGMK